MRGAGMALEETPDMVYGRLCEGVDLGSHTVDRVWTALEWLLSEDRWRQVGPGYTDINVFLRSVNFSAFKIHDKRPELVRRLKELQPEASQRAIAEALGVGQATVHRDLADSDESPGLDFTSQEPPGELATPDPLSVADSGESASEGDEEEDVEEDDAEDEAEPDEVVGEMDEDEEELPAFLCGEGWTLRERAHTYARYLGLPAALQPTVADLLHQPGICANLAIILLPPVGNEADRMQRREYLVATHTI
jgi:hypothetical protein